MVKKQLEIENKQGKINLFETNKKKLEVNKKIDEEIVILRSKIESEKGSIRTTNNDIEKNKKYYHKFKRKKLTLILN